MIVSDVLGGYGSIVFNANLRIARVSEKWLYDVPKLGVDKILE